MPPRRRPAARAALVTRRQLAHDPARELRLAVVADTHSRPHPEASARLHALKPQAILHGGDVGDLAVLDELAEIAPVHAVRGNIDSTARELPERLLLEVVAVGTPVDAEPLVVLRILLLHIAVAGPFLRPEVATLAHSSGAQLVVCGHSHVPFLGRSRGLPVFNPGSIGPRRFSLPIALGWITLRDGRLTFGHIDCETGAAWSPP